MVKARRDKERREEGKGCLVEKNRFKKKSKGQKEGRRRMVMIRYKVD